MGYTDHIRYTPYLHVTEKESEDVQDAFLNGEKRGGFA